MHTSTCRGCSDTFRTVIDFCSLANSGPPNLARNKSLFAVKSHLPGRTISGLVPGLVGVVAGTCLTLQSTGTGPAARRPSWLEQQSSRKYEGVIVRRKPGAAGGRLPSSSTGSRGPF